MTTRTQFKSYDSSKVCDVVIGFDFGTSCSKVIVRTPYQNDGRAFAVPFRSGHKASQYLLPSALWLSGSNASLSETPGASLLRDIKLHLMRPDDVPAINRKSSEKPGSFDSKVVAVCFLAAAMRETRKWFLDHQEAAYRNQRLRWSLNLGLPSADFNDTALCESYDQVAGAAWCLSVTETEITLETAEAVLGRPETWERLPEEARAEEITLIPEVAAEVAGYAQSRRRQNGLFVLVDVGASTLDICSFILHEVDGEDSYELLTADVSMLGATILYQYRVAGVRDAVNSHMSLLWDQYDPVSAVPENIRDYAPSKAEIEKSLAERNNNYQAHCRQRIWTTIQDLKINRDPNSPRWTSYLPVFLAGGGSAMSFYQDFISDESARLSAFHQSCEGIEQLSLEKPSNLVAHIDPQTYHRLAVAWGLSFPETDIGSVTPPSEIQNIESKESIDPYEGFISKDMV